MRVNEGSTSFEGIGHQQLRLIVYARHVATLWCAWRLAMGIEALHKLLVVAELHSVLLVPPTPGNSIYYINYIPSDMYCILETIYYLL